MNNDLGLIAIENGNFEMKRLKRRLKNNPYLARKNGRKNENGRNWTFWRALNWILEEDTNHFDLVQLAKAEILGLKISKTGIGPFYKDFKDPDWTPEIRKELKQNPDWIIS